MYDILLISMEDGLNFDIWDCLPTVYDVWSYLERKSHMWELWLTTSTSFLKACLQFHCIVFDLAKYILIGPMIISTQMTYTHNATWVRYFVIKCYML